jgi:Zn-dependent protease with chaperone function
MAATFEARLFGPGLPQDGEPVRVSFAGSRLQVHGSQVRSTDAAHLSVGAAGFEQSDALLSWSDAEGDWGVMVGDPAAKIALVETAPAILARPLGRWRRSVGITRGIWRAAIGAAIVLALGAGLVWWQYDRVLGYIAAQIPLETERRIGRQAVRSAIAEGRTVEAGMAYATLVEIGDKLTRGSRYQYSWYLADNPQVNAFALPGGYVVVNAGLVYAAKSPDELAAVLAHEVQHVEQRHSLQQILHQLGWATLLAVVVGDASAITSIVLLQLGNTAFNRDLETQADLAGIAAMRAAGVPPQAMATFFKGLRDDRGGLPTLLSTHPATEERIKAIEAAIANSPCEPCSPLAYDWEKVRESLVADGLIKRRAPRAAGRGIRQ